LSIDKNNRHRGSDAGDAPLPLEADGAPVDRDVVIGGKEGDQADGNAAEGLQQAEPIRAEPAGKRCH
jgi:hypothetical protein